jgi:hypothetical protein
MNLFRTIELNLCGLKYALYFYQDDDCKYLGLSLKDINSNSSVVSLKKLLLEEFLDSSTTIEDICGSIEDMLNQQAEELILDSQTGEIRLNANDRIRNFIESEI